MTQPLRLEAPCQRDDCGQIHEATYSHEGTYGEGPIFAVVCTVDWLTSYHTTEGLTTASIKALDTPVVGP